MGRTKLRMQETCRDWRNLPRLGWVAWILATAVSWLLPAYAQQESEPDPLTVARSLLQAGKTAESEKLLRDYISVHPSSADAHFLLGYARFREQKPRESLAEFTAGAQFRRPGADDFRVIASDYVLLGDFSDAEKWFLEVTKEKPDDPEAWYLLGRAQYNEDRFAGAAASFERVLTLRPGDIEAENNLGLARQGLNDPDGAAKAYRDAIEWQGGHPVDAQPYLNLGILLCDQNQPAAALPYLQQAARLAPGNPKAHEQLGRAWEMQKDLPRAQQELERAASLAPEVSGLHFRLGRIYQHEGLRDLARQQFALCEKLDRTHSSAETPNPAVPR